MLFRSLGRNHPSFNRGPSPAYGYGGQPAYQQSYRGPPPGADPQLWQWFSAVDTDRSGAISATELQAALVNGAFLSVVIHAHFGAYIHVYLNIGDWSSALFQFPPSRDLN